MTPIQALHEFPKDFLRFKGTASRSEYCFKFIYLVIATVAAYPLFWLVMMFLNATGILPNDGNWILILLITPFVWVAALAIGIPLTVRRIKDTGVSGWAYLVVVAINALLAFTLLFAWVAFFVNIALILYCALVPAGAGAKFLAQKREEFAPYSPDEPTP